MLNDTFTVLHVDLNTGIGTTTEFEGRSKYIGGSGLAAMLFKEFGKYEAPAFDPQQPLIFAVGPLTGMFPLMSKTVAGFKSPYNNQYAESHGGGRSALAIRFAGFDALVLTGRAPRLSCLVVGSRNLQLHDVHYLKGVETFSAGKFLRKFGKSGAGHRSSLRIGPAGENMVEYAAINVDTYRHFGRLGSGAVMGSKNLKALVVLGDKSLPSPENNKEYKELFEEIHKELTATDMMHKYHNLGTVENIAALNELQALPWNNLQKTKSDAVEGISGERIAEQLLLRQAACAGCPVGCIHIGLLRHMFAKDHEYLYRQVSYDYEPVFAEGSMLGMEKASDVLAIMDETEKQGLDVMSAGVALAWATEAFEKGLVGIKETIRPLAFNDVDGYLQGIRHLGQRTNSFYETLGKGALVAAQKYGGDDFACVLGQEMAGYATGEVFFVSQAYGFRHSHLDSGGYSYDQSAKENDAAKAIRFLQDDEEKRVMLTCMVSCLFARKVYSPERLKKALDVVGMEETADRLEQSSADMQRLRWNIKCKTGFDPAKVEIPKRFKEVVTWKGEIDDDYMNLLRDEYAKVIHQMSRKDD